MASKSLKELDVEVYADIIETVNFLRKNKNLLDDFEKDFINDFLKRFELYDDKMMLSAKQRILLAKLSLYISQSTSNT